MLYPAELQARDFIDQKFLKEEVVRPERFELPTLWFVAKYSIQLSYGRTTHGHPAKQHLLIRIRLHLG